MPHQRLNLGACAAVALFSSGCHTRSADAPPAPLAAAAATTVAQAAPLLAEFDAYCRRVGSRPWAASLCGPLVLVDPESRLAIANRPDPRRRFDHVSGAYVGTLADDEPLANTAVDWNGQRWAMLILPAPTDTFNRLRLFAHESFHRIQPNVGIQLRTPANVHLEERDARLWLRLELRALARAVTAPEADARAALADGLIFRAYRNQLFPGTDTLEAQLEMGEGTAEYAGVRFAMDAMGRSKATVLQWSRARFERTPTFVRSLGYGTGPALGLALDRFAPGWQTRVRDIRALTTELAARSDWVVPADLPSRARERAALYEYEQLAAEEESRAVARARSVAEYRAKLIDGPVVVFRQRGLSGGFDPNSVLPLGDAGTVYPQRTVSAEWGTLRVSDGGLLVSPDVSGARVRAAQELRANERGVVAGPGWELQLADGWTLVRGPRAGDWQVMPATHEATPRPSEPEGRTTHQSSDSLTWTSFRWRGTMMEQRVVERSVLQVPVRLPNAPDSLFLQLDTGSDQSMFYEIPYREVRTDLPTALPRFVFEQAVVGTETLDTDTLWLRPKSGRPIASTRARTIGTLGADVLRRRVLVLDFGTERFALLPPGAALPPAMDKQAHWAVLTQRDGKLFVRARIGGAERDDLFFDSGSSAFPLVVRRELWGTLTGRRASDAANDIWMASSWGRAVPLIGAPLDGSFTIAGIAFPSPMVFFHGDTLGPPGFFETSGYPVSGYFGNALFADSATVVIDVPRRRFGVIVGRPRAKASARGHGGP